MDKDTTTTRQAGRQTDRPLWDAHPEIWLLEPSSTLFLFGPLKFHLARVVGGERREQEKPEPLRI